MMMRRWVLLGMTVPLIAAVTGAPVLGAPPAQNVVDIDAARLQPMQAQVVHFRSPLYGDLQPLAVCATELSATPKPLIVELIPGSFSGLERAAQSCERICRIAKAHGKDCVAIRPCGRGDGSVYQGYGEVDVYEAIDAVRKRIAIDPDRISVSGVSMGGAATWYHASHYPDFWSAAAPFCGYCDYRLWAKPGGTTFHRQPWEEFSWISRGAAYRAASLRHVALRITHGEWDRAVGGGVPVEHSRQMARKLTEAVIPNTYIEVPKTGHSCRTPELWDQTVPWLLEQKRVAHPDRITLTVHTLRHNRSHWVAVEQQFRYGQASTVDTRHDRAGQTVEVETQNVYRLTLGPLPQASEVTLKIDETELEKTDLTEQKHFVSAGEGKWVKIRWALPFGQKRAGLSGPFGDLFIEPTVIVYGTSGSDAERAYNMTMARNAVGVFNRTNGGVHRVGITGDNVVAIPILSDSEFLAGKRSADSRNKGPIPITAELLARANLLCIGNFKSNAVLARLADELPVVFGETTVKLAGKTYQGDHLAFYAILPHPDGKRYVAMLAGNEPDAICWGSHVGVQLLPDYLVFDHERAVEWGFWDSTWRYAD